MNFSNSLQSAKPVALAAQINRGKMRDKVLDIIIELVKGVKNNEQIVSHEHKLGNIKYLLNQTIRQIQVPQDHYYISKEAQQLWSELTNENIEDYVYTDQVPLKPDVKPEILQQTKYYVGASKEPQCLKDKISRGKFQYNHVFHDEHMISIDTIINKLINFKKLNYNNVKNCLNNIYICRITKQENIALDKVSRNKRPYDLEQVKQLYERAKIEVTQ